MSKISYLSSQEAGSNRTEQARTESLVTKERLMRATQPQHGYPGAGKISRGEETQPGLSSRSSSQNREASQDSEWKERDGAPSQSA